PELRRGLVDQSRNFRAKWISGRSTTVQRVDQRSERSRAIELVGTGANHADADWLSQRLIQEARFADPRFAFEQDDLADAAEARANRVELIRPAKEVPLSPRQPVHSDRDYGRGNGSSASPISRRNAPSRL